MKKRRVFIAVNLPAAIKKRLFEFAEKHSDSPVCWTAEENLHITLLFIGWADDEETAKICQIVKKVVSKHPAFEINLAKIDYDSEKKLPRMVWAFGKENREFAGLENDVKDALAESGIGFDDRYRNSLIHITLGRIIQSEWRGLPSKPKISEQIDLKFEAGSVEVMESWTGKKGSEYVVLESALLGFSESN